MIKKFKYFIKENANDDDIEYEDEQEEISFSDDEVEMLEKEGFERRGYLRFCFPGTQDMNIEISKNEDKDDGHIYYRVIIDGYLPGNEKPVSLYKKRFKTLDYAIRRLNVDIDEVIMNLMIIVNRLGA